MVDCGKMTIFALIMMEKARGIVVRTVRYGDASVIANVYTDKYGMLGFIAKMPKAGKSAVRNLLLCPLAILEIDFDYRDGRDLHRLKDVRLAAAYGSLPYHPVKETMALFLAEFLFHALRNEHDNAQLFYFLEHSLLWLDNKEDRFANFPLTFLLRLTLFLGIWPSEEEVGLLLSREEKRVLPLVLRMDYGTMHLFRFTSAQRSRLMQVANEYYRLHVAGFPELKSVAILHEVCA